MAMRERIRTSAAAHKATITGFWLLSTKERILSRKAGAPPFGASFFSSREKSGSSWETGASPSENRPSVSGIRLSASEIRPAASGSAASRSGTEAWEKMGSSGFGGFS